MKTVLILGAGDDQVSTYLEARRMGLRIVGADMRSDAPGAALADEFLPISSRDAEALGAAVTGDVSAVVAPAGDVAQPALRALADRFGTPWSPSAPAARASCDKGFFRDLLVTLGLAGYAHVQSGDLALLDREALAMGLPVVVKPADSSGSKGLAFVRARHELPGALGRAREQSPGGIVIVEQYVAGRHLSAECFLDDGDMAVFVLSERVLTGPPAMITLQHRSPPALPPALVDRARDTVRHVCKALGLHDGPANFDLVVTAEGGLHVVEMGSRLGGNGMPELVRLRTGVDTVRAGLQLALGERPDLEATRERAVILHILHSTVGGRLLEVRGLAACHEIPEVVEAAVFVEVGDDVRPYVRAANKLGYLMLEGPSMDELNVALERALSTLRFRVVPVEVQP